MPMKPKIIIAHVDASGTAATLSSELNFAPPPVATTSTNSVIENEPVVANGVYVVGPPPEVVVPNNKASAPLLVGSAQIVRVTAAFVRVPVSCENREVTNGDVKLVSVTRNFNSPLPKELTLDRKST